MPIVGESICGLGNILYIIQIRNYSLGTLNFLYRFVITLIRGKLKEINALKYLDNFLKNDFEITSGYTYTILLL